MTDEFASELQDHEELFHQIIESNPSGIILVNTQGNIILVNHQIEVLFGYPKLELIGQKIEILVPEYLRERHPSLRDDYFKKPIPKIMGGKRELYAVRKNGQKFFVEIGLNCLKINHLSYAVCSIADISERLKVEKKNEELRLQLLQADKMASLGILTSGVAHEINNPNHLIMSNTEILSAILSDVLHFMNEHAGEYEDFEAGGLRYHELKEKLPEILARIHNGSTRIRNIVDSLRHFSRTEDPQIKQDLNINFLLKNSLVLAENILKKATSNFSTDLSDDIPTFKGNSQQIEQVILNLITNSCQSLNDSSESIVISSRYDADNNMVVLSVRDEGSGIDKDNLLKIMEPFFTTKRDTGGTGLGLYVSYSILKNHGGRLRFFPNHEKGTIAEIHLPRNYPSN